MGSIRLKWDRGGGNTNLSEILGSFKRDKKEKRKVMEHQQTVKRAPSPPPPKGHPRLVDNCLVYVYLFLTANSNFNNIKSSKFPISINFTNPLRKTIYSQIYPKITKNVDMWNEQRDF